MGENLSIGAVGGVIFDAVGTLIYAEPPVAVVYAEVALRQGIRFEPSEIKHRFSLQLRRAESDDHAGSSATDEARERQRWQQIVAWVIPELPDLEAGFDELWEHFALPAAWRCYPDVSQTLRALRFINMPVRIASNFDARLRGVVAGLADLESLQDPLVISSEVGFRKPHRAIYQAACASLNLAAEAVLSVGDDLLNDVEGARRAGLPAVWLNRVGTASPPIGVISISSLSALLDLLIAGTDAGLDSGRPI
ncbi:MAG TPA: HAD-IA family hydrolase [Isosphaeraceae bacterium]|jgi:putative hydrolase of the HAD superfamily|nr:HAD-IA family hydrolase [Isosphaeraceae bacterium]